MTSSRSHRVIALLAKCAVCTVPVALLTIVGFDGMSATPAPVSQMLSGTGVVTLMVVTRRRLRTKPE